MKPFVIAIYSLPYYFLYSCATAIILPLSYIGTIFAAYFMSATKRTFYFESMEKHSNTFSALYLFSKRNDKSLDVCLQCPIIFSINHQSSLHKAYLYYYICSSFPLCTTAMPLCNYIHFPTTKTLFLSKYTAFFHFKCLKPPTQHSRKKFLLWQFL